MRILALETDIEELKKKFLVQGEQAVLVTHRHYLAFVMNILWQTGVTILVILVIITIILQGFWDLFLYGTFLFTWFFTYAYFIMAAFIAWRYNFIIVTTQKVVIVEQKSLFYQHLNPLHFDRISNTRVETQFGGIFRCGILHINMTVPERGGQYMELANHWIPKPEDIAAVIENGLVLAKTPVKKEEEQDKKAVMQEPARSAENPTPDKLPEQQKLEAQGAPGSLGLGAVIAASPPPPPRQEAPPKEKSPEDALDQ